MEVGYQSGVRIFSSSSGSTDKYGNTNGHRNATKSGVGEKKYIGSNLNQLIFSLDYCDPRFPFISNRLLVEALRGTTEVCCYLGKLRNLCNELCNDTVWNS